VANVLVRKKRLEVFAALVAGNSIRRTEFMTGVHQDTIGRFGFALGQGSDRVHDRLVQGLTCPLVDLDEQHSWVGVRQQNLDLAKHDPSVLGEQWTWAAICRSSKLTIAWLVGKRDQEHADTIVADLRARLVVMPQITTDGLKLYERPIAVNFGPAVPYCQTVKNYAGKPGRTPTGEKFAPPHGVDFIQKRIISGTPDLDKATTYAIERSNGTNRQWNRRLVRRTLCFSKKFDRHCASVALMFVFRNLCHVQRNMRRDGTAAMVAGITDHIWELEELMDAALAEPEGEKPVAKPLVIPRPEGPTRELPGDRGWLRVVKGGDEPAAPPAAPPGAPGVAAVAASPAPEATPAPAEVRATPPAIPSPSRAPQVAAPVVSAAPVVVVPEVPDLIVPPRASAALAVPVRAAEAPASVAPSPIAPSPFAPSPFVPSPSRKPRGRPVNPAQLGLFDPPRPSKK
jgi:IS1 family transposase